MGILYTHRKYFQQLSRSVIKSQFVNLNVPQLFQCSFSHVAVAVVFYRLCILLHPPRKVLPLFGSLSCVKYNFVFQPLYLCICPEFLPVLPFYYPTIKRNWWSIKSPCYTLKEFWISNSTVGIHHLRFNVWRVHVSLRTLRVKMRVF